MNHTAAAIKTKAVFQVEPATPEDVVYALELHGHTVRKVAEALGIEYQSVRDVIFNRRTSKNVATYISQVIGIPVNTIWPGKYQFR